jgi:hypothetical protein
MTTFTLKDYVENKQDAEVVVEPIPFAGMVAMQDKEDTETMLRHQLHILNERIKELEAEVIKLKKQIDGNKVNVIT